jgi:ATP-dependent DNA helicase RecG
MTGRPEVLFPLFAGLDGLAGVGPKTAAALAAGGIETPRDLLFTLPHSGVDRTRRPSVRDVAAPATVTVEVTVGRHQPPRTKGRPYRVEVTDASLTFQLVFFHAREDWLKRQLPTGQRRVVSGKVELFDGIAQMVHPDHIVTVEEAGEIPAFEPVYPLTGSLTQKQVAKAAAGALERAPELPEWIDPALCKARGLARLDRRGPRGPCARARRRPPARCARAAAARL